MSKRRVAYYYDGVLIVKSTLFVPNKPILQATPVHIRTVLVTP